MKLRLTALAVLLTALMLGPLTGRAAAVSRSFFGVVPLQPPTASEYTAMGRGKVGTLRIILSWANVEPTPGQRNWAPYDEMVANASAQGIQVLATLYGSPGFAASSPMRPPVSTAARAAFAQFVTDAVNRYKLGGSFWQSPFWTTFVATHPGAQPVPITDWQLLNEVNSPSFWAPPRPSPRQYGSLLKLTAHSVRAADPGGRVILAGLFTRPSQRRAIPIEEFLDKLYRVKGIKSAFDALAVHPYARRPGEALRTVKGVRRVTRRHGDGGSPIWVTELGWASGGTPSRYTTTSYGQASRLEASFNSLAANAARFGIQGVIWYSLRDGAGGDWLYNSGLFALGGTPKPAWSSFVRFTGGVP